MMCCDLAGTSEALWWTHHAAALGTVRSRMDHLLPSFVHQGKPDSQQHTSSG